MRHYCDTPGDHPHSSGAPILRPSFYDEAISPGPIYVCGGLHYMKANPLPHFTLTLSAREAGGCMHDEILARFPELAPLAALHLSDIDGVPMHADANGLYWLNGFAGGLGERFHGGNGTQPRSPDECIAVWADHVRLPVEEAHEAAGAMLDQAGEYARATGFRVEDNVLHAQRAEREALRQLHTAFVEAQRPRWKDEANRAMHALGIRCYFGDRWAAEASRCGHETVLVVDQRAGCAECGASWTI